MNVNSRSPISWLGARAPVLAAVILAAACAMALADAPATNSPPATKSTPSAVVLDDDDDDSATNAAASKHGITIITDKDGNTKVETIGEKKHSGSSDSDDITALGEVLLIPLAGILATFGMPVLIVFLLLYFRFRRRQETLATVREYLNKGLPVPPELLVDSGNAAQAAKMAAVVSGARSGASCDLNRGFKLTFVGLAIAVALYIHEPHSTTWGWGMIPAIMGVGYLASGWLQSRDRSAGNDTPPGNPPPKP